MNSNEVLKKCMSTLLDECKQDGANYKQIIAKAVSLGMKYEKEKIKGSINEILEN